MKRQNEKKKLGELLIERGFVTPAVVEQLLGLQSDSNERLASLAVRWKHVTEVQALEALSEQKGVPGLDLHQVVIPLETLSCVPLKIAEEYGILPIEIRDGQLFLAMTDPSDRRVVDEIEFATGFRVFPYVCLHATLHRYVHEAYKSQRDGESHHVGNAVPLEDSGTDGSNNHGGKDPAPGVVLEISEQPSSNSVSARFSLPPTRTTNRLTEVPYPPTRNEPLVLVIDSRSNIRQALVRDLKDTGFGVEEVDTGSAGLHAIRRMLPDVIVLHSKLTDMHAFEICRRLKDSERYGDIRIIVTSEHEHDWRVASDAKHSLGVDLFVENPSGTHTVVEAVALSIRNKNDVEQDQKSVLTQNAAQELKNATAAYKAGDRAQAVACLRAGLQIDPLSFRLHYHLGLVLAGQSDDPTNDVFGAIDALEASVAIRPKDFSALKNLATLYQRVGFVNKSIELWQRALQAAPDAQKRAEIRDHLISLL